jgi:DNA-binding transcriptional ArsR family regulator
MTSPGADRVKLTHALLNEKRVGIVTTLLSEPTYISKLEKRLKIDRSTVCYHLNILEEVGLVQSEYKILEAAHSKGRAGRTYSVNRGKLKEAIKAIEELKCELSQV